MTPLKAVAINGSPNMAKGNTARVLGPFIEGMTEGGCEVDLVYAKRLKIEPCSCGGMACSTFPWPRPGESSRPCRSRRPPTRRPVGTPAFSGGNTP